MRNLYTLLGLILLHMVQGCRSMPKAVSVEKFEAQVVNGVSSPNIDTLYLSSLSVDMRKVSTKREGSTLIVEAFKKKEVVVTRPDTTTHEWVDLPGGLPNIPIKVKQLTIKDKGKSQVVKNVVIPSENIKIGRVTVVQQKRVPPPPPPPDPKNKQTDQILARIKELGKELDILQNSIDALPNTHAFYRPNKSEPDPFVKKYKKLLATMDERYLDYKNQKKYPPLDTFKIDAAHLNDIELVFNEVKEDVKHKPIVLTTLFNSGIYKLDAYHYEELATIISQVKVRINGFSIEPSMNIKIRLKVSGFTDDMSVGDTLKQELYDLRLNNRQTIDTSNQIILNKVLAEERSKSVGNHIINAFKSLKVSYDTKTFVGNESNYPPNFNPSTCAQGSLCLKHPTYCAERRICVISCEVYREKSDMFVRK